MDVKPAAVLLAALLVAGCGGHNAGYPDARSVAKAAGCTQIKSESPEMFAADSVTCRHGSHYETVQWFKDNQSYNQWASIAGIAGGLIIHGGNWAIECDAKPDCDAMQQKIGGNIS